SPRKLTVIRSRIFHLRYLEVLREEVSLFRQPDHGHSEAGGSRYAGAAMVPRTRHERGDVLQMACEVRRHGRLDDGEAEGAGRREPAAEEDVRRGAAQGRDRPGGAGEKVVKPSRRREMAQQAVAARGRPSGWPVRRSTSARPATAINRNSRMRTPRSRTGWFD